VSAGPPIPWLIWHPPLKPSDLRPVRRARPPGRGGRRRRPRDLLTAVEAATWIRRHYQVAAEPWHLYRLAREDYVPSTTIGPNVLFNKSDLRRLLGGDA
jgi:hypothetical protein